MRIVSAKYPGCAPLLVLAVVVLLAGCGSGRKDDDLAHGSTLTIYTSLPLHGVSAAAGRAVAAAERMALSDAGARAGGRRLRLVVLDNADPTKGVTWDPASVERNAKRAAKDPTTIAYIGELDFGGSAVSVPVTNGKGILQVSPGDGLTSLTQIQPGGFKTSPARYYPRGARTFVRLVPNDLRQADELIDWVRDRGSDRLAMVHDDRLFGREMSAQIVALAPRRRLSVTEVEEAPTDARSYAGLARKLASKHPDAVAYLGAGGQQAALLLRELSEALPGVPLYGSSGLDRGFSAAAGAPAVDLLDPVFPPSAYGRAGTRVLARLARRTGVPQPSDALYGYAAMSLVIESLDRAGSRSDDRAAVVSAALAPGARRTVLGGLAIQRTGDVLPTRFAAYRLARGRLQYEGPRPAPSSG